MGDRKQINFRANDDLLEVIDELRAMMRPIPSTADVIREALYEKLERMQRQRAAEVVTNGNGVHHDAPEASTIRLAHVR